MPRATGVFIRSAVLAALSIVALVSAGVFAFENAEPQFSKVIAIDGLFPPITIEDLEEAADAIVILTATGKKNTHWNSANGRVWTSDDDRHPAYIYRDEQVNVIRVLRGSITPGSVGLRQYGGVADGVKMIFGEDRVLEPGRQYLAFLDIDQTPTELGVESRWTIVRMGDGLFDRLEGVGYWVNDHAKLAVSDEALEALSSGE